MFEQTSLLQPPFQFRSCYSYTLLKKQEMMSLCYFTARVTQSEVICWQHLAFSDAAQLCFMLHTSKIACFCKGRTALDLGNTCFPSSSRSTPVTSIT